jgi:hypothetical protein
MVVEAMIAETTAAETATREASATAGDAAAMEATSREAGATAGDAAAMESTSREAGATAGDAPAMESTTREVGAATAPVEAATTVESTTTGPSGPTRQSRRCCCECDGQTARTDRRNPIHRILHHFTMRKKRSVSWIVPKQGGGVGKFMCPGAPAVFRVRNSQRFRPGHLPIARPQLQVIASSLDRRVMSGDGIIGSSTPRILAEPES